MHGTRRRTPAAQSRPGSSLSIPQAPGVSGEGAGESRWPPQELGHARMTAGESVGTPEAFRSAPKSAEAGQKVPADSSGAFWRSSEGFDDLQGRFGPLRESAGSFWAAHGPPWDSLGVFSAFRDASGLFTVLFGSLRDSWVIFGE